MRYKTINLAEAPLLAFFLSEYSSGKFECGIDQLSSINKTIPNIDFISNSDN